MRRMRYTERRQSHPVSHLSRSWGLRSRNAFVEELPPEKFIRHPVFWLGHTDARYLAGMLGFRVDS
jgi:hypothetical protein